MAEHDGGGGARRPPDDYAVGYCRPPAEHRFRAGDPSRNPRGRRGKARPASSAGVSPDFLDGEITLSLEGKPVRMTRDLAIDHALFQKAMKGNVQASRRLDERRAERERRLRTARSGLTEAAGVLSEEDEAVITNALERRTREPAAPDALPDGQPGGEGEDV